MASTLVVFVMLAGSFAFTWALMWCLQRRGCFADPVLHGLPRTTTRRPIALPLGPDDDAVFLRELRRRIDLGHFRH